MSNTIKNIGKGMRSVTVKLGKTWERTYFEGEVTRDDVQVIREDPVETSHEGYRGGPNTNTICTKVLIKMDPAIIEALEWTHDMSGYDRNANAGQRSIMAYDKCESNKESTVKAMRTRHRKRCERELSDKQVEREVAYLVRRANLDIERSRTEFVRCISDVLAMHDSWTFDRQDEIDEINSKIEDLSSMIKDLKKERHAIVSAEMEEWLSEKIDDESLRAELMEKSGLTRELPVVKRRKKMH